jgi:hypothetical protein
MHNIKMTSDTHEHLAMVKPARTIRLAIILLSDSGATFTLSPQIMAQATETQRASDVPGSQAYGHADTGSVAISSESEGESQPDRPHPQCRTKATRCASGCVSGRSAGKPTTSCFTDRHIAGDVGPTMGLVFGRFQLAESFTSSTTAGSFPCAPQCERHVSITLNCWSACHSTQGAAVVRSYSSRHQELEPGSRHPPYDGREY